MTAEQIREWSARGIEFGAHSRTHRDLTSLSSEELLEELAGSRDDLAGILGAPVTSFAYPYGIFNEGVRKKAGEIFAISFTCQEGVNNVRTDSALLLRTMVHPSDSWIDLACRVRMGWNPISRVRGYVRLRTRIRGVIRHLGRNC